VLLDALEHLSHQHLGDAAQHALAHAGNRAAYLTVAPDVDEGFPAIGGS
jgi:hypothetical protein